MGPGNTIAGIFTGACRWKRDAEFLVDDAIRLTGAQALERVQSAAAAMRAKGLGQGDTVAFLCAPSVRHAVAFFAAQMLGAVCCAVHVKDTGARLVKTLDRIGASAIVADQSEAGRAAALADGLDKPPKIVAIDPSWASPDDLSAEAHDCPPVLVPVSAAPSDPAVILCSSGTTGDPKCVLHTQATIIATTFAGPFVYGVSDPGQSVAVPMAPSFAAWVFTVMPFVAMRAKLVFMQRFDVGLYQETIAAERLTFGALVPTAWRMIMGLAEPGGFADMRAVFFSGEKGSAGLVADLATLAPAVRTAYLASEGGCAAAVVADERALIGLGKASVAGRPVPGADLKIIAPDGGFDDVLPDGETGEVAIYGASVAAGYLGDAALTEQKFTDGWWRTGDLGVIDEDGYLEIRGRADNRINSGGIKIHAEEVENALLQHPAVRDAAVIGVDDPTLGERIEAHLVITDETVAASDITDFCTRGQLLPKALLPKAIHFHKALPTSPTGKLYRKGLRDHEPKA